MVAGTVKLSFRDIAEAKANGTLTWDDYLHKLLASWTGVEYKEHDQDTYHRELQFLDPFAHTIWHESLVFHVRGVVEDIAPVEAVFKAYRYSLLEDVKAKFAELGGQPTKAIINTLALLALQDRRADVLNYCLNEVGYNGPPDFSFFNEAVVYVDESKDPAIFGTLERSTFRKVFPKEQYNEARAPESYHDRAPGPRALLDFDVGGKFEVKW